LPPYHEGLIHEASVSAPPIPGAAYYAGAQQLNDNLKVDPNVTVGKLPNGSDVLHPRQQEAGASRRSCAWPSMSARFWRTRVSAGWLTSVEHMAFNGTEHFKKQELVKYLESIGMRFGADVNAFTSFDEDRLHADDPTDSGKALEQGCADSG
jgi:zinc protease